MSVESMAIALHHSRARGTAKLVLLGIANHDGDGGAWPSMATLQKYAGGVDVRNVQRAVAKLVELGEVVVDVQRGGTLTTPDVMRPNLYAFQLTCPGDCDRTKNHRTARDARRLSTGQSNPPAPAPPPGAIATPPPGASATRTTLRTNQGTPGLGASTTEGAGPCGQPPAHSCDDGWLEDTIGRAVPCALCRPAVARRVARQAVLDRRGGHTP